MGGVAQGQDDIAFFAAYIEETRELSISTGSTQTSDDDGPLTPGRWLIQVRDTTNYVWIKVGKYEKGIPLVATAGAAQKQFPLSLSGLIAIELNVREGDGDRIAAITEAGGGTLYLSRVSREY